MKRTAKATLRQPKLFATRRRGSELPKIADQLLMLREEYVAFPLPVEEHYFARAIGRQWRFDYAWPEYRVALEIEGGVFGRMITGLDGEDYRVVQSRHTDPIGMTEDAVKYNQAAILGWIVLRATDHLIRDRRILEHVLAALRARGWKEIPR
jgi:hypothetical protein